MEEKIKRYLAQILCVLCAVALWLFVTYTKDPEMKIWIHNVPVSYIGEDAFALHGLTFTSREYPEEINVKVTGKRSLLQSVTQTDVHAVVDFSGITTPGTHDLPFSVSLSRNDLHVAALSQNTITCQVDSLVTMAKPVIVRAADADTLKIRDFVTTPPTVNITGPQTLVESLTPSVFLDLNNETFPEMFAVTLLDAENAPYMGSDAILETSAVSLTATRAIPVNITAANVPENAEIEKVECQPSTVDVQGTIPALLAAEDAHGAYSVWVDFFSSPAKSHPVSLVYPENVTPLNPTTASALFYYSQNQ